MTEHSHIFELTDEFTQENGSTIQYLRCKVDQCHGLKKRWISADGSTSRFITYD